MAETNIKLLDGRINDNGNQVKDVQKFFDFFVDADKDELRKYFFTTDNFLQKKPFTFKKVVDILINVRHRVVHGKSHYHFRFYDGRPMLQNIITGETGGMNAKRRTQYQLELRYERFRDMIVSYAIENIMKCL